LLLLCSQKIVFFNWKRISVRSWFVWASERIKCTLLFYFFIDIQIFSPAQIRIEFSPDRRKSQTNQIRYLSLWDKSTWNSHTLKTDGYRTSLSMKMSTCSKSVITELSWNYFLIVGRIFLKLFLKLVKRWICICLRKDVFIPYRYSKIIMVRRCNIFVFFIWMFNYFDIVSVHDFVVTKSQSLRHPSSNKSRTAFHKLS
jgi:hypothetical protein